MTKTRILIALSVAALALTLAPAAANASAPTRLICNEWVGNGDNLALLKVTPRRCSIWRATWAHYQSATFKRATWSHWGASVAVARATLVYNMGYRKRVTVRAYRLRWDCTGQYRVYTRVRVSGPDGSGVVKPDTCPTIE